MVELLRDKIKQHSTGLFGLRAAFRHFDTDNSRSIDFNEFSRACSSLGLNLSQQVPYYRTSNARYSFVYVVART